MRNIEEFDDEWTCKCFECGNDTYRIILLGTPTTPADIRAILTKCTQCGRIAEHEVIKYGVGREN